jgi:hypothetical protein
MQQFKEIIAPIDRKLIEEELQNNKFIRKTNFGKNYIYIVTAHDSPNTMREIGRLRELTFRTAGGGTGEEIDIDEYDTMPDPYRQLIVWNPAEKEIIGGYRYIVCDKVAKDAQGNFMLATSHLFKFSEKFINEYLPYSIELGRSFVQPQYQPLNDTRKGLFAMDNIWDGLGAVMINNPKMKYFFGKMTMYLNFNVKARDMIMYFLERFFPNKENLVEPYFPRKIETDIKELDNLFCGSDYKENYKILVQNVRFLKENIPPLVNTYMNISPSMHTFGAALNETFGDVEEIGLLVTINDIYDVKKARHLHSYNNPEK